MDKSKFLIFSIAACIILSVNTGCSSKNPTNGTILIKVIDYKTNLVVPNELVYIALSYDNLKNHIWLNSLYTDVNGKVFFHDLNPVTIYYDTEHWENYGAAQIYAGIDESVILYVDTPIQKKR